MEGGGMVPANPEPSVVPSALKQALPPALLLVYSSSPILN